ncbi:hypothetical protein MMC30_005965 [Trapelia coarctata]|nr:hypothetical protein [Trapelia coarctata]
MGSGQLPVLIIGAGIAGLTLAQALKKRSIPFLIFERDRSANSRLQGWALTIHFSLPQLISLLPEKLTARLDSIQVNPSVALDRSDSIFINLADCGVKWRLPPGSGIRKRVARDRFRQLLLDGLDDRIFWGKELVGFELTNRGVKASFSDGSAYEGLLVVGVDGAKSRVRDLLYSPQESPPKPIPVSFLGTSLHVNETQIKPLLELDPVLFQGCHPPSSTWMWHSIMESPETNGTIILPPDQHTWKIQLCLSWLSSGDESEIPDTDAARVLKMREKARDFEPRLRSIFYEALHSSHSPILSIKLVDWYLPINPTRATRGRVTLAGDAAHTMAMYRGEGFNHAIMDDYMLLPAIERMYDPCVTQMEGGLSGVREQAIAEYETELRARGRSAVEMCREACLEVHQWEKLNENSAVRMKRIL